MRLGQLGYAVLIAGLVSGATADAQSRSGALSARTSVLDDRADAARSLSIDIGAPKVITPTKFGFLEGTVAREHGATGPWAEMARAAARRHNIPEALFLKLVETESNFDPQAVSHKGAIGLAQLMPGTARQLRVDPYDPEQNLDGGARYLRMMRARFGTWRLALAAYNAGPGAVEQYDGIPPYKETRNYVRTILGR